MPTRFIQVNLVFPVEAFFGRFLASQQGWSGGSAEDIADVSFDTVAKTLKVVRVPERDLTRWIVFSAAEVFAIIAGHPAWGAGTAADIKDITLDAAGRKIVICKVSEIA